MSTGPTKRKREGERERDIPFFAFETRYRKARRKDHAYQVQSLFFFHRTAAPPLGVRGSVPRNPKRNYVTAAHTCRRRLFHDASGKPRVRFNANLSPPFPPTRIQTKKDERCSVESGNTLATWRRCMFRDQGGGCGADPSSSAKYDSKATQITSSGGTGRKRTQ